MRRGFIDFHIAPPTSMLGSSWLDTREVRGGAENTQRWEVPQKGHRGEVNRLADWWDGIEEDRSLDGQKATRLVNVIARLKGEREEKRLFLVNHMALLEAEAGKEFDPVEEPRQFAAKMKSLAFRFWRGHLKDQQRPRMNRDLERPQEQGPRGEQFESLGNVIEGEFNRRKAK